MRLDCMASEQAKGRRSAKGRLILRRQRRRGSCGPTQPQTGEPPLGGPLRYPVFDQAVARAAASLRFLPHQTSKPPQAIIRPGNPAPTTGPGTAAGVRLNGPVWPNKIGTRSWRQMTGPRCRRSKSAKDQGCPHRFRQTYLWVRSRRFARPKPDPCASMGSGSCL
jgi:hypothetical protein